MDRKYLGPHCDSIRCVTKGNDAKRESELQTGKRKDKCRNDFDGAEDKDLIHL